MIKPGLFALFIDWAQWTDRNELSYKNSNIPPTDAGRSHSELGWAPDESDPSFPWSKIGLTFSLEASFASTKCVIPFPFPLLIQRTYR